MLRILAEKSTPTCVVAECADKITAEEYAAYTAELDAAIAAGGGSASAVFLMSSSPMDADWAAIKADARFGTHEYRALRRVAYAGDVKWVDWMVAAFGWITKAEEKTFAAAELDEAIVWACG